MKKSVRVVALTLVLCILTAFFVPYIQPVHISQGAGLKITLDPGHGGSDPGTYIAFENGGSHYESWYNLEIAKYAQERLEKYGVTVYMTRTSDTEISLSERVNIAVNNGSDALISIHNNSAATSSASGSVVCVPNNNYRSEMSKKSSDIAHKILENLADAPGTRNRGLLKESYKGLYYPDGSASDFYAINRYAKLRGLSASMIIECAFCTNPSDVSLLEGEESRRDFGYSIADGIAEYYGLAVIPEKPVVPKYSAEITPVTMGGKAGFNDDYSLNVLNDLNDGSVVSFKVKADSGYKCSSVKVGGNDIAVQGNGTGAALYQTKISGGNIKIDISFEKILYNLGVYRVTTDSLNVRELPNADDTTKVLGQFFTNERFTVTEIVNSHWGKVIYNGKVGYISIHLNYAEFVSDLIIESNDIVFDNEETVKWINDVAEGRSKAELYTDQTTEDVYMRVADKNGARIVFEYDKLGSMSADQYKYVIITAKIPNGVQPEMIIYTDNNLSEPAVSKTLKWQNDDLWHNYVIDLSGYEKWTGEVSKLIFKCSSSSGDQSAVCFRNIRFMTYKPTNPSISLSNSIIENDSVINVSYSGLDSYFSSNENISPYVAVYTAKTDYMGEPLFKQYLTQPGGSFDFSAKSVNDNKMEDGDYVFILGFDAKGSKGKNINLHNVFFNNAESVASLSVKKNDVIEPGNSKPDKIEPDINVNESIELEVVKPEVLSVGVYRVYIPDDDKYEAFLHVTASQNAPVKMIIPAGEYVYISEISDSWGYTVYNGINGWINIEKFLYYVPDMAYEQGNDFAERGDIHKDGIVNVFDVYDIFAYKRGYITISENVLNASGVCYANEAISIMTLIRIYRIIMY